MISCRETPPLKKFLTTSEKITKKCSTTQAMKANFYTKKPTVTTLTVEKIAAKTAQVTNKRNLK